MRRLLLCLLLVLLAVPATAAAAVPPLVVTGSATTMSQSEVTVRGTVDPNGTATMYRFEYTSSADGDLELRTADAGAGDGTGAVPVQESLTGLAADTTYRYRLIAWPAGDPEETVTGAERTFRTPMLPGVNTGFARNTGLDHTTLVGKVDPNRLQTDWWYQYGTTSAFGETTPVMDAGRASTVREVTTDLTGLSPHTTYHYRIVAENAAGRRVGRRRTFRTARQATGIVLDVPVQRPLFGSVTQVRGQVQGVAVNRIRVALEAQRYPFKGAFVEAGPPVTTADDGSFSIPSPPLWISTRLRVVSKSGIGYTSDPVVAYARVRIGTHMTVLSRRTSRIEGLLTPRVPGARVSVQRLAGKKWVLVRRTRAKAMSRGRYGYGVTVPRARKATTMRVVVQPKTQAYAKNTSRTLRVPARPKR
jgi:hypothetical protein